MKIIAVLFWFISFIPSTTDTVVNDEYSCEENPSTYDTNIKGILQTYCMDAGCHIGGKESPGNFETYKGLSKFIKKNTIENRVLELENMPPEYSEGPTVLPDSIYNQIKCWVEAGYPEE